jgi:nitrogen-specific signal transduction histidine kinase
VQEEQIPPPVDAGRELETIRASLREIAHEINNPLGVLRMTAYFLDRGDVPSAKLVEYAGLINQSLDRIENGMKRLNDLRRGIPPAGGS